MSQTRWGPRAAPRIFPLQPLLDAAEITQGMLARRTNTSGHEITIAAQHGLTVTQADRLAIRCGFHPAEVYGDLWWQHTLEETA